MGSKCNKDFIDACVCVFLQHLSVCLRLLLDVAIELTPSILPCAWCCSDSGRGMDLFRQLVVSGVGSG